MNFLPREQQIAVIAALCDGLGVRATSRITGVNRGTVAALALKVVAEALGRADGADAAIVGHMVFSEKALGWIVRRRMAHSGNVYRWGTHGVNFDAAYRNALFGAAQVLAGQGAQK